MRDKERRDVPLQKEWCGVGWGVSLHSDLQWDRGPRGEWEQHASRG